MSCNSDVTELPPSPCESPKPGGSVRLVPRTGQGVCSLHCHVSKSLAEGCLGKLVILISLLTNSKGKPICY